MSRVTLPSTRVVLLDQRYWSRAWDPDGSKVVAAHPSLFRPLPVNAGANDRLMVALVGTGRVAVLNRSRNDRVTLWEADGTRVAEFVPNRKVAELDPVRTIRRMLATLPR